MKNIITLSTNEDKDEIKKAIKEMIIEQIRNDFENTSTYLIDPSQIENMFLEVVAEVKDEVRGIYLEVSTKRK